MYLFGFAGSSVQFSCSVVPDSLRPHGLQHARLPCPSPTSRAWSNSCPLSRWCHPSISSSVVPFSSCFQSFPASGSFRMSRLFTSGGQSIGASASASVLPENIQHWFPLGWTGWISLRWVSGAAYEIYFPDQGSNLDPSALGGWSPNHWTTREVAGMSPFPRGFKTGVNHPDTSWHRKGYDRRMGLVCLDGTGLSPVSHVDQRLQSPTFSLSFMLCSKTTPPRPPSTFINSPSQPWERVLLLPSPLKVQWCQVEQTTLKAGGAEVLPVAFTDCVPYPLSRAEKV